MECIGGIMTDMYDNEAVFELREIKRCLTDIVKELRIRNEQEEVWRKMWEKEFGDNDIFIGGNEK